MELTAQQQAFEQIVKANKILIALPKDLTADRLASGLALRQALLGLKKEVLILSSGSVTENLTFLPGAKNVQNQSPLGKSLIITVDTVIKKLEEISYETANDKAKIFLKSKDQPFSVEDLSFSGEKFLTDLVIILGARSLMDLGQLYEQSTDIFFETAKVNIDNQPDNEYFGQINIVDITATSLAEILTEMLQKNIQDPLSADIATSLLTGIIAGTHSFREVQTTPRAFFLASELITRGARQQEIVRHLFKTKSLQLLRLWGRALARMKVLPEKNAIYSLLNASDFEKSESSLKDLPDALAQFAENVSGYKIVGLLAQNPQGGSIALIAVHEQLQVEALLRELNGQGRILDLTFGRYRIIEATDNQGSLEELEKKFLGALANLPS